MRSTTRTLRPFCSVYAASSTRAQKPALGVSLLSRRARPARFVLVGGCCGLLQILLLVVLKLAGLPGLPANIAAYLLSAQVNFVLSNRFIWHDRWPSGASDSDVALRWLRFHVSIAGTFLLSQAVFVAGRFVLADVFASALGIGVSAAVNYLIQDRLTFRLPPEPSPRETARGHGGGY